MNVPIYQEASKIWKGFAQEAGEVNHRFELELHRKLLTFFQVGDYYYYVFNMATGSFDYVSPEVSDVLGYPMQEVSVPFLLSIMHPNDQPYFLNFANQIRTFFAGLTEAQVPNYKVRYDYRLRRHDGSYIRILQQSTAMQYNGQGNLLRVFGVHTNITDIKENGVPVLSFIGLNGEPSFHNVDVERVFPLPNDLLTPREKEVLALLIEGHNSEQVARVLEVSEATVHTHRKNMLRKASVTNTAQLIVRAIREGWV